ncbi:MAG: HAD family hydrolase [Bdellovibrionaceae bacterium]|nr:HAD family hydrolase [Pseudobdellovibrionaceae bacterium]
MMNTTHFWQNQTSQLIQDIETFLNKNPRGKKVAAFDADGTCWFNDVGRDFYLYQCENIFKNVWQWSDYTDREKKDVGESLWWLAEINHGATVQNLIRQAQEALIQKGPLQIVPSVQQLIRFLLAKGVEVFIVTASVKWSVVPAARELGINEDHVLGVTTLLDLEQRLTLERYLPITWREGKPEALLNATDGVAPFLCGGNTISDLPLLESATDFRVSVNSVDQKDSIFESEQQLKRISLERQWFHFDYLESV